MIQNQKGNVIWFILLAVALLGFLTAVISRGTSSVEQSGNIERASIQISQTMQYAKSIQSAIEYLTLTNGCSENEISFENTSVSGYENIDAPTDKGCHIFDPAGGAVTWKDTDSNNKIFFISKQAKIDQSPSSSNDDVLLILRDVSATYCLQLNKTYQKWTETPSWDAGTGYLWSKADGSYGTAGVSLSLPRPGTAWKKNVKTACFYNTQLDEYDAYHVLILR